MKRLLLFLSAVFIATTAIAEQITINWGTDNQLYTTTTCEIGDNVILPSPPTKRGYTFRGWKKDSFNRGTWANWSTVPSDTSLYLSDTYNNSIPLNNDYIVIQNSSDYINIDNSVTIQIYLTSNIRNLKIIINGTVVKDEQFTTTNFPTTSEYGNPNIRFKIKYDGKTAYFVALTKVKYRNTVFNTGETILSLNLYDSAQKHTFCDYSEEFSDTWRFIYQGVWDTDGKNGWKPETQITE